MKNKLFLPIFFTLAFFTVFFGSIAFAASGSCPTDGGASSGIVCSDTTNKYFCLGSCNPGHGQCTPTWNSISATIVCASLLVCPTHCDGVDLCGYCNHCSSGYVLRGSYPNQICEDS